MLRAERMRDPRRRPLLVVVTDGRATHGGPGAVARAAALVRGLGPAGGQNGVASVVVDCEEGPVRLGLAVGLAAALGGEAVRLGELGADRAGGLARLVRDSRRGAA